MSFYCIQHEHRQDSQCLKEGRQCENCHSREEIKKNLMDESFGRALDRLFEPKQIKEEATEPFVNNFIEGEKVNHIRFGNGTITKFEGEKCHVVFDSGIEKDLLMKFAKLKSI